jgi:hypothetical protein
MNNLSTRDTHAHSLTHLDLLRQRRVPVGAGRLQLVLPLAPPGQVLTAATLATLLAACGGGSGSGNSSGGAQPAGTSASMSMSCADGPAWQCSGGSTIRVDNGVALTSSGVQAYGKSTSDLANPIVEKTTAYGLAPASGGTAEVRLAKDANGVVSRAALLLSNLGRQE